MELLHTLITDWNKGTNERTKLQNAYVALIIAGIVVAGIVTLVNPFLGHDIIVIIGFLALAAVANAIIWALLKTFVVDKFKPKRSK